MIWVGLLRIGVNPSECRRLKRHGKSSTNRQPDSRICQPYDGLRKGRFYEDKRSTESSDYHLILGRNHPIQGFGGSIWECRDKTQFHAMKTQFRRNHKRKGLSCNDFLWEPLRNINLKGVI